MYEGLFAYGQIISRAEIANFKPTDRQLDAKTLAGAALESLFVINVMNSAVTSGRWKKIGKRPTEEHLLQPSDYFIVDKISGRISLYRSDTGSTQPGTAAEASTLECAAVWSAQHVEDRLRDHFHGIPNKWLTSLRSVLPAS